MVASDLDYSPPALFGLTAEELPRVVGGSLVGWLLLSLPLAAATGVVFLLVVLPLVGTVGSVYAVGRAVQGLKRGRPDGWVNQHLYQLRERLLGVPLPWLHRSGVYELR